MKKLIPLLFLLAACTKEGPTGPSGNSQIQVLQFSFEKDDLIIAGQNIATYIYSNAAIKSDGIVQVFQEYGSNWLALPYTFPIDIDPQMSVEYVLHVGYSVSDGSMQIVETSSMDIVSRDLLVDGNFKVIVLPQGE
jgi:hypothetical protein